MLGLYTLAIFVSAALLFMVQPMAAKQVLPLLGGTPAVWTTSMLFFQAALLAGYAYSHGLSKLRPRAQAAIHTVLLIAVVFLALPIGLPESAPEPPQAVGRGAEAELALYLLRLLAISVGLPFFLLATTGPLLQKWFSRTGHAQSADPYFLYAASNAGSFLGLLAYPFLVEPFTGLREQERWWSTGFMGFVALAASCAIVLWLRARRPGPDEQSAAASSDRISWSRRGWWVLLAAVPSSLLLGATQHISTDVAAMPLLWVIPLALYLLTFVLAFATRQFVGARVLGYLVAAGAIGVALATGLYARKPMGPLVVLHIATFFFAAWMCHKRLAESRPSSTHLTEYFLWMSVGGMVGGLFNALLAPAVFSDILEYPIALVAACLLRPLPRSGGPKMIRFAELAAAVLVVGLVGGGIAVQRAEAGDADQTLAMTLRVLAPAAVAAIAVSRTWVFAAGIAVIVGVAKVVPDYATERVLHQERSFYGVHRVKEDLSGSQRVLIHGTTWHGLQNRDLPGKQTRWEKVPTTYYHPSGPVGQMFIGLAAQNPERIRRVGIIGLGVGSIAAYALPGARFTFYEIDDAVIRIASDPSLFTFLSGAGERAEAKLGDGRLVLSHEPDGEFDVIVLDAFSSDSVPAHVLTVEAFEMYRRKLKKPGGIIAANITNLHLNLSGVMASAARELGLTAIIQRDPAGDAVTKGQGHLASTWVLMGDKGDLSPMIDDLARWSRLEPRPRDVLWTDSYSSLVRVLK
ncbi:MAG: fused MFS/spermidine synthase [Phycisphaerales bacterium]|nr:fused MFS/spermidine synthase [Phycisphaerales bacterium]